MSIESLPVTPLDVVLGRLDRVRKSGDGFMARCPAHEDRTPSLSVKETDEGTVLVHCFAGCLPEEIAGAIGLNLAALFSSKSGAELMRRTGPAVPKAFRPVEARQLGRNAREPEPLPFVLLSTALENVPSEPEWTWKGYLASGAVTLIGGRPKVGKSTLLFGLLAALEAGKPFAEQETRASGVLLLSEERLSSLAEKAARWELNGRVHLLMRHQANHRDWPSLLAEAVDYCRRHGLDVLAIDTFAAWSGLKGDAENNAGAILEALEPVVAAAGEGLAVLICAHQRKSFGEFGEAVRGSNALTGGVDVVLELERPRSDALAGDGVRVLQAVSRFSGTPEELVIALGDQGYEARGDTLTAQAEVEREQVLAALQTLGEATYEKLHEETGLTRSSCNDG